MKKIKMLVSFIIFINFPAFALAENCKEKDVSNYGKYRLLARGDHRFDCFQPKKLSYQHSDKDLNKLIHYLVSYTKNDDRDFNETLQERAITQREVNQIIMFIDNYELSSNQLVNLRVALMMNKRALGLFGADYGDLEFALKDVMKTRSSMDGVEKFNKGSKCWWVFGDDFLEVQERLNGKNGSIFFNRNLLTDEGAREDIDKFLNSKEYFTIFQCGRWKKRR